MLAIMDPILSPPFRMLSYRVLDLRAMGSLLGAVIVGLPFDLSFVPK